MEEAAARFAKTFGTGSVDAPGALAGADKVLDEGLDDEALLSDAAAFLGEALRRSHPPAQWEEDGLYGPVVTGFEGIQEGRLLPLPLAQRKVAGGAAFSLPEFAASLSRRLAAEREAPRDSPPTAQAIADRLRGLHGADAQVGARREAESFREFWKFRQRADLPLTLLGVREVERWLRTHQVANFLSEGRMAQAGFFVGEVGRGLFGGEWDFAVLTTVDRAALRFPELDYLPVGRIYRLMVEGAAPQPLDEYLRLIPSARRELARQREGKDE